MEARRELRELCVLFFNPERGIFDHHGVTLSVNLRVTKSGDLAVRTGCYRAGFRGPFPPKRRGISGLRRLEPLFSILASAVPSLGLFVFFRRPHFIEIGNILRSK